MYGGANSDIAVTTRMMMREMVVGEALCPDAKEYGNNFLGNDECAVSHQSGAHDGSNKVEKHATTHPHRLVQPNVSINVHNQLVDVRVPS